MCWADSPVHFIPEQCWSQASCSLSPAANNAPASIKTRPVAGRYCVKNTILGCRNVVRVILVAYICVVALGVHLL